MNEDVIDRTALAKTAPEIPASMKAAVGRTQAALAEQQNVERALDAARAALRQAEQEHAEARDRLAAAEAGTAVGGGDVDKGARKRLLAARDEADFAHARVTGLEEHLRAATTTLTVAQRTLAVEFRNWKREQSAALVEQVYQPALVAVLDVLRTLVAAGTALGVNRLLAIPRQAFLCDPNDPMRNLASRQRLAWRDHPEAAAHYERLAALVAELTPLLGEFADGPIPKLESGDAAA